MTRDEFDRTAQERRRRGHEHIVIKVRLAREPRGERVRVFPAEPPRRAVYGRYVGWHGGDCYIVDVTL